MALIKTGPNRWKIRVSVRVKGKSYPVTKKVLFSGTKTEAEAKRVELIKDIRESGDKCSLKKDALNFFSQAVTLFKEKRGPFSPSHERKINFLESETGHLTLLEFPDRFEAYLRILKVSPTKRGTRRSPASINRFIEIARAVYGLLVQLEIISRNPITKARFPKGEEKPRDRYLSEDERLRLMNAVKQHRPYLLPFIEYSIAVPCRKAELVNAKREQYSPFTNTIYIPDSKANIPINKPVPASMVEYFRSIPPECPYLFFRKDESGYHPLGDFKKAWRFCLKKAGLQNVRVHDLRHVAASDLYADGVPERMIMDIAGWKTPMLSTYRHRDSLKSAQQINNLFSKKPTEQHQVVTAR